MTPYFDPRWLVLMIVRTDGFQRVWSLVHRFSAPFTLNPVHHLILENALQRLPAGTLALARVFR